MEKEKEFFKNLTKQQKDAVKQVDGTSLIIAGAGTGKTTVITKKVQNILEHGTDENRILALTFTKNAALEMQKRIEKACNKHVENISTFHSFAYKLIKKYLLKEKGIYAKVLDVTDEGKIIYSIIKNKNYKKYEENTVLAAYIKRIAEEKELNNLELKEILKIKNYVTKKCQYFKNKKIKKFENYYFKEQRFWETFFEYEKILKEKNLFDFTDLLKELNQFLEKNKEIAKNIQNQYDYILVDEYQDTNILQIEILKKILKPNPNFTAVGDDSQSIYGFRGANIDNILSFEKEFENVHVFKLEENFRSTPEILDFSNYIINQSINRIDKNLFSNNENGNLPKCYFFENVFEEANFVLEKIEDLISSGENPEEIAILARTHNSLDIIKKNFDQNNIPFVKIKKYDEDLKKIFDEEELEDLKKQNQKGKITINTIHSVKGLEFKYVFLVGINMFNFPLYMNDFEEEIRLFY